MSNYLETNYFRDEYSPEAYPQKLCNFITEEFISKAGAIENKKLLDIGSGKGNHLVGFARNNLTAYGLDKRDECIEVLKDFDIRYCDLEKDVYPFESNYFDIVFSKSVIEHVSNTDNFMREALRVLKPGGLAIILTPDWRSQYLLFWDDYTHVKAFTRKALQNVMLMNGFSDVHCDYFLQLPFVWRYPWLKFVTSIISILPDSLKWKDKEERQFRELIRFSKEKMLLARGYKPDIES